jgi:hypothetical protein
MRCVPWLKKALEFLGGERDEPPGGGRRWLSSPLWGLWWGVLACLIAMFCGQSSKFIYIDF